MTEEQNPNELTRIANLLDSINGKLTFFVWVVALSIAFEALNFLLSF